MKHFAVIVAGGKGNRMKSDPKAFGLPKQFIKLGSKPILMHTIEQFYNADQTIQIILVLPSEQIKYWQELRTTYGFEVPVLVTAGGPTRFHSVKNGLSLISESGVVAVHDGVRPFVSKETILNGYEMASRTKSAIPVVQLVDSIRMVDEKVNTALNRSDYRLVQTPQVFDVDLLQAAYKQPFSDSYTDDASVVEANGHLVSLFEGNPENIKITTPFDLIVAEVLVANY
jgi:2-C-methyl-D-erythritol 4-phosphate cytidylyltransferase